MVIAATESEVDDKIAWIEEHYANTLPEKAPGIAEDFRNGPLVGTPEQIVEKLTELRALGMTYAIINLLEVAYDRSSLTLFTEQVAPALATA